MKMKTRKEIKRTRKRTKRRGRTKRMFSNELMIFAGAIQWGIETLH